GIGVFGYIQTTGSGPGETIVLKVGNRTFGESYVERRLRYEINNAVPGQPILLNEQVAVVQTLNAIEGEELNRQGAPDLGISVSNDEIDAEIRKNLRLTDSSDQNAFAAAYRQAVLDSGLTVNDYREVIAATLLEDKIRQHIRDGITDTAEQIKMRDIRVAAQADAQTVLSRLAAGEDFATVAANVSTDIATKNNGGDMDWTPLSALSTNVANAVLPLSVGQLSAPVQSSGSYTIYQVMDRQPNMPVTSDQRTQIENQSYLNWEGQVAQQVTTQPYYISDMTIYNNLVAVAKQDGAGQPTPTPASASTPASTPPASTPASTPGPTSGQP
ncbi:MAG: peptidylprolyl isomerase, partial [Dehalococcoidia bacterium]